MAEDDPLLDDGWAEEALGLEPELLLPQALSSAATASAGRMTLIEVFTVVLLTCQTQFVGIGCY
jgi:hypothetical protein